MKIDRTSSLIFDDSEKKLIVKQTHDHTGTLETVRKAREVGHNTFHPDMYHIGTVDAGLLKAWAQEAGVKLSDTRAMSEIVKRKMLSSEFRDLRNWEGTY